VVKAAPGISPVNISGLVEAFRAVKSAAEIACLREAGKLTAAVHREMLAKLVEGQTDSELATNCFAALARLGSDPLPMAPLVVAGARSALAHATYANIPIRRGELITQEFGGVVKRYCAPTYRVAMIGQPSAEARRFHDASRDALLAGLDKIGPGMTSHDADRVVRESIQRSGYLDYFTVRAAYSVGLGFVPSWDEDHIMKLRPNDTRIVKPGMVFHLVPALYKPGLGAACCSNTICVTEDGVEALVPIEPELLIA
jgi:Xaa-Pro dipeptidase